LLIRFPYKFFLAISSCLPKLAAHFILPFAIVLLFFYNAILNPLAGIDLEICQASADLFYYI